MCVCASSDLIFHTGQVYTLLYRYYECLKFVLLNILVMNDVCLKIIKTIILINNYCYMIME